jgi:Domain of unknown function (DUF4434)
MKPWIIACALIFVTSTAAAAECPKGPLSGLFYQPLLIDLELSSSDWKARMERLSQIGITEIYLQWTAYGDADFTQQTTRDNQPFLLALYAASEEFGISLHFGLIADPEWFQKSLVEGTEKVKYLQQLRLQNAVQARKILAAVPEKDIAGWYLPEEITASYWVEPDHLAELEYHLTQTVGYLQKLTPGKNIAISGFTGGRLSAEQYTAFWRNILGVGGLVFLHQDGEGTAVLGNQERDLYVETLHRELLDTQWGVIAEIFRQQSAPDEEFYATAVPVAALSEQLSTLKQLDSELDITAFSLRYLFQDNGKLLKSYEEHYCL